MTHPLDLQQFDPVRVQTDEGSMAGMVESVTEDGVVVWIASAGKTVTVPPGSVEVAEGA